MFGIGNLFDPTMMGGMSLFGAPGSGGSPAWGQIPPPGAPPSLLSGGGGSDTLMGGNKPIAMAKADEPAGPTTPPLGLIRAGEVTEPARLPTPEANRANSLYPDTTAAGPATLTGRVPESTTPMTGITSPSLSPQYTPTPPTPLESGGPGGNIRAPYNAPTPAPATATPAPGTSVPSTAATATTGGGAMGKLGDIGKALASAGGAQAGKAAGFAPGGVGAAHTPDGSALMQAVMKMHDPTAVGPVPGLPPGLLQRFRQ